MGKKIEDLKVLDERQRKRILKILNEQFGIEEIPGILVRRGKERIFLYQGNFNEKSFSMLKDVCFVERCGVYFAKDEERGIRLSIEGTQILKDQIKKNIVELDEVEMQTWMMGHEVRKKAGLRGFVVIQYGDDFLGTGKASEEKITNFIPKSRRLKDRTIEE